MQPLATKTHNEDVTDKLLRDLTEALGPAYLIERELQGGGMSRVFVAREHALGREVVIKVLPPDLAAGINRERFRREVQLAARITHPYIVPLLNAGEAGELLWFTMPYISGDSLRTMLEQRGPLPVREVIQLLRDVVEALSYAHARGVIHRDIKPANILTDGVHAMVTDFGVAKALGAALPLTGVAGHTTSGMAIGTPAYMAPEQLAADPVADHRVDIYAVGLLAYELLTGASPFAAPSPTATMTAQLTRTPESLTKVRADVPPALAQLVDRCLSKSPDDRPANAQAVLAELDRISGALAAETHREGSGETSRQEPRPASSLPLALAALGVIALMLAGVWWGTRRGPVPEAAAPESVVVMGGNDDADGEPLPSARPLTRADSLAIAAALRDELERIDPAAAQRLPVAAPAAAEPTGGSTTAIVSLERQLSAYDSVVRVRLAEISARTGAALAIANEVERQRNTAPVAAPASNERKSVMVLGRGEASLGGLANSIVNDLTERLRRSREWELVAPQEAEARAEAEQLPAEVLVMVGVSRGNGDSVVARVAVRNLSPGSQFGYTVITSDPFVPTGGSNAYREVTADAMRTLNGLLRLRPGQQWTGDMGRLDVRVTPPDIRRPPDTPRRNPPED